MALPRRVGEIRKNSKTALETTLCVDKSQIMERVSAVMDTNVGNNADNVSLKSFNELATEDGFYG